MTCRRVIYDNYGNSIACFARRGPRSIYDKKYIYNNELKRSSGPLKRPGSRLFASRVARPGAIEYRTASVFDRAFPTSARHLRIAAMKVRNSLKSAKLRDKNCQIVRRKGRVYLINKKNPRFKARQG